MTVLCTPCAQQEHQLSRGLQWSFWDMPSIVPQALLQYMSCQAKVHLSTCLQHMHGLLLVYIYLSIFHCLLTGKANAWL